MLKLFLLKKVEKLDEWLLCEDISSFLYHRVVIKNSLFWTQHILENFIVNAWSSDINSINWTFHSWTIPRKSNWFYPQINPPKSI
jgi:hypothetical protein